MTTWLERGSVFISTLEIPADADAKACRKYLIARGMVEAPKLPIEALAADIIFPFREQRIAE